MRIKSKKLSDQFKRTDETPSPDDLLSFTRLGYKVVEGKLVPIDREASQRFTLYVKQLAREMGSWSPKPR